MLRLNQGHLTSLGIIWLLRGLPQKGKGTNEGAGSSWTPIHTQA
jgi:hypothetical protein